MHDCFFFILQNIHCHKKAIHPEIGLGVVVSPLGAKKVAMEFLYVIKIC